VANKAKRYLSERGNKWWFKRDIPAAIRHHFGGRTAFLEDLDTRDLRVAKERRDELAAETDRLYREAKAGRVPLRHAGDPIRDHGETWAAELRESRIDPHRWTAKITGRRPEDVADEDTIAAEGLIEEEAERLSRVHGAAAGARFKNIAHGHAEIDYWLDGYLKEAGLAPKTTAERRALVRKFVEWAQAKNITLAAIDRAKAGEYVTAKLAPRNRRTAGKHLTALTRYWEYLGRRGIVPKDDNPWTGQLEPDNRRRVERGDGSKDEREFTADEMRALLYPPRPIDGEDDRLMDDIMRIAALSGMRLAEIVTLWAGDVELDEAGAGAFDLKQGKNENAARVVPLHSDLVEIVQRRLKGKAPTDSLFPELAKAKSPSDTFGKRFANYRVARGVDDVRPGKRRSLVNFHSFRRWFVTEAERAGLPLSTIALVVGHEEGRVSQTGKYSGGPSVDQKRRCVEAVKLPVASK
jgi:site-specific recombinase XerD